MCVKIVFGRLLGLDYNESAEIDQVSRLIESMNANCARMIIDESR